MHRKNLAAICLGLFFVLPAASGAPVGYMDFATCDSVQGWATANTPEGIAKVEIWLGLPDQGGTKIGETLANRTLGFLPPRLAGHAFDVPAPSAVQTGKASNLYGVAVDATTGERVVLNRWIDGAPTISPMQVNCPVPTAPRGYMDKANCNVLQGWAVDRYTPGDQIKVQIWRDGLPGSGGVKVADIPASQTVPELPDHLAGHGFLIPTPPSLADGQEHKLYAIGIHPSRPKLWVQLLSWRNNTSSLEPFPIACARRDPPAGFFKLASCNRLEGWARNPAYPDQPVPMEVWEGLPSNGGVWVAGGLANTTLPSLSGRPELAGHGFSIATPARLKDGGIHQLYIIGRNPNVPASTAQLSIWDGSKAVVTPMELECQQPTANLSTVRPFDRKGTKGALANYRLDWNDEFDGNALDLTKWKHRIDNRFESANRAENVRVVNGTLVLDGKKESFGGMTYSSGGVISKDTFSTGYYEARIKMPATSGFHTSFWTRAFKAQLNESDFEMDFCEHNSMNKTGYTANLHRWRLSGLFDHQILLASTVWTEKALSERYYIWGAEVTATEIRYYFDGKLVGTRQIEKDNSGNPLILNEQNIWLTTVLVPANEHDFVDEASLPGKAQFDWVRHYSLAQ